MYPDPEGRQCQSKLQKIKRLQFQNCSPGPRRGAVDQLKLQKFRRLQFQNCRPEREAVPTQDTKNRHTTSELRIQGSEGPYKLSKYCHTPSLYSIGLIGNFVNAAHHTGLLKGAKDLTNQVLWGLSPWIVRRVGQCPGNWSQGQTKAGLKQPAVVLQDQKN